MGNKLPTAHLSYWSRDESRPILSLTAGAALAHTATHHPERIALVEVVPAGGMSETGAAHTNRRWTYAELMADATQCAHWFLNHYSPGDRVCLWAPNVPEWIIVQYGAALAGIVLVTANPALSALELEYVLKQSRASGLVYCAAFRGSDMATRAKQAAAESVQLHCLTGWLEAMKKAVPARALPDVAAESPAQIQYTSGTTGKPKGALLSHFSLVTNASLVSARAGIDASVVLSPMPLFHTAGAVLSSLGCVVTGSTLVLPLMFEPRTVLYAIERERAEVIFAVPTMLIALMESPERATSQLSSLRVAISGGAPIPPVLLQRIEAAFACDFLAVYGQTEAGPVICQTALSDSLVQKSETAGQPLPQVEVRIANAEGDAQSIGVEGEIQCRGYQTMIGYFEMEQATKEAFTQDAWLRTGDLGVMDVHGYVRVTGRLKDMIIRGGENIYPAEVEAKLLQHPDIVNACVFAAPDPLWGEVVCAALLMRDAAEAISAESLKQYCRQTLGPQKVPTRWFVCDALPMTGSGKIQKFRLQEWLAQGLLADIE